MLISTSPVVALLSNIWGHVSLQQNWKLTEQNSYFHTYVQFSNHSEIYDLSHLGKVKQIIHQNLHPHFNFNFSTEVQLLYNIVFVSSIQQSDSILYICIYIQIYTYIYTHTHMIFHILFHYGLSQGIEYSSLFYTVGPCCLSVLYIVACIC